MVKTIERKTIIKLKDTNLVIFILIVMVMVEAGYSNAYIFGDMIMSTMMIMTITTVAVRGMITTLGGSMTAGKEGPIVSRRRKKIPVALLQDQLLV